MNLVRTLISRIKYSIERLRSSGGDAPGENVIIGRDTDVMDSHLSPNISVGARCFLYKTTIGSYSYLSQNVSVMNTVIGKYCSIAQGTVISGGMHPADTFVSTSPVFYSLIKQCGVTFADRSYFREMGNTVIGNDVWIGANAIIKDDVQIGNGAIIGAGAVVTKDVPDYAIVVGCPAKIVRYRFTDEQISFLLRFKWWDKEDAWVRENFKDFHNIEAFIKKYMNNQGN